MIKPDASKWTIDQVKQSFEHWNAYEMLVMNSYNTKHTAAEQWIYKQAAGFFYRFTYLSNAEQDILASLYYYREQPQTTANKARITQQQLQSLTHKAFAKMTEPRMQPLKQSKRTTTTNCK